MNHLPFSNRPAVALFVLATLSAASAGGELRPELVPADAFWVAHFDVAGLQRSALWEALRSHEEIELDDGLEGFEEIRTEFGLDPLRDVRSATVYGMENEPERAVVVFDVTGAVDAAFARIAQEEGYRFFEHEGLGIHGWEDGDVYGHVHGAGDERLVLFSPDLELLVRGARLVDGEGESLADSSTPRILARPQAGSFAFAAASEGIPGIHEIEPASKITTLAQGIVLDVGEQGDELHVHAEVMTRNPEDALNVSRVLNGAMALAQLAVVHGGEEAPPQVRRLVSAVRVATRGNAVRLSFRYPVRQLLQELAELEEHGG